MLKATIKTLKLENKKKERKKSLNYPNLISRVLNKNGDCGRRTFLFLFSVVDRRHDDVVDGLRLEVQLDAGSNLAGSVPDVEHRIDGNLKQSNNMLLILLSEFLTDKTSKRLFVTAQKVTL